MRFLRNAMGLGFVLCVTAGVHLFPLLRDPGVVPAIVVGLTTSSLYLAGYAVGRKDAS